MLIVMAIKMKDENGLIKDDCNHSDEVKNTLTYIHHKNNIS